MPAKSLSRNSAKLQKAVGISSMEIPTLTFGNFVLRAFTEHDVEPLRILHSDPDIMRYLSASGEPEKHARDAWNYISLHLGHWHLKGYGKWALADSVTHQLIGRVGYFNPPYDWPGLELGWTISKEHWGKGIARQAADSKFWVIPKSTTEIGAVCLEK